MSDPAPFANNRRRRPTVSVVIPSYNGAAYIHRAIESVLRQTALPDAIIVVDDCSRDGTVAAVEVIGRTAPVPIHVIQMTRNSGGPAEPINAGVEASTSDLIAVLEQDDRMTPRRIARSLDAFRALPAAGLVCGRVELTRPDGQVTDDLWKDGHRQFGDVLLTPVASLIYRAEPSALVPCLLRRNLVFSNSNAVFPRSAWRQVGGFNPAYGICSDLDFNLRVARAAPFAIVDEVLCQYHQRAEGLYNSNVLGAESRAHFEAAFIRMRHALEFFDSESSIAAEWYWRGRYLLATAWRRRQWRRCVAILAVLFSTGTLKARAAGRLKRMLASASTR